MYLEDVEKLDKDSILDRDLFVELMEYESEIDRTEKVIELVDKAKLFGVKEKFKAMYSACLKEKKKFDADKKKIQRTDMSYNMTDFSGNYTSLNCGCWIANDGGIYTITMFGEKVACPHPILPIQILTNAETGFCKVKLAYKVRNKWREVCIDKEVISSNTKITSLSKYGIMVTSENAKALVQYLSDIESLNEDSIVEQVSTSKLGWIGGEFMPYGNNIVFDNEQNLKCVFDSIKSVGDRDTWYNMVKSIRKKGKLEAKIYIVASLASVLVEPLNALPFVVNLWGDTGKGKAQPLDTKIITENGYKLMGDIKVGDTVIGGDGKSHNVTGVYPQGELDVFEITFSDGTKTRCCDEHLWNVRTKNSKNKSEKFKTLQLSEIRNMPLKKGRARNLFIPVCNPVEFKESEQLPISPYVLGLLIGDGCITLKKNLANRTRNVFFSNTELDVIERLKKELSKIGARLVQKSYTQYYLRNVDGLKKSIKELGLNVQSGEKFIPTIYKQASISDRMEIIKGLFDTDGNVSSNGSFSYSTSSKQLAEDFSEVCRSLGYRTTIRMNDRTGQKYFTGGKEYTRKSAEYIVHILTNDEIFHSDKHKSKIKNKDRKCKYNDLAIVSIEKVGKEQCQCIMVDSKEHTYLCDDYIVTHNTVALMLATSIWASPNEGAYMSDAKSTTTAMEARMGFLNNLPMLLDDMAQVKNQYDGDFSSLVYLWCAGKGKERSNRNLGLNSNNTWRNVIITNAEHSLVTSTMQGGAVNRIIDVEMSDGSIFDNGNEVVETLKSNYGFAGREFVEVVKDLGVEEIKAIQKDFYDQIVALAEKDGVEKEEKQILPMSILLTADKLANEHLFHDGYTLDLQTCVDLLKNRNEVSENERAYQFVLDEVSINMNKFKPDTFGEFHGEQWGVIENGKAVIIGNAFNRILQKGGFSEKTFLSWALKNNIIDGDSDGKTKKVKRLDGRPTRCVFLRLERVLDEKEMFS